MINLFKQVFFVPKAKRQQHGFICAKAKRQQQGFICAKAKRQQQQHNNARLSDQHHVGQKPPTDSRNRKEVQCRMLA
ncbi:hypothetical protein PVA17_00190 [Lysinibacillus sp. CNPSo 3705]|uniref:hypothetical protein n=1 Tax=Lysinibacillus sp. CNPSo 3705 TaxID=3028148 RepID=UPI0023643AD1|nr:hypothetical protein [Lysinibacillus sp. CNPSo 3705]MDD1501195.1 hypothetical protein [Lysinibacillus sp. CNPSo 3705]